MARLMTEDQSIGASRPVGPIKGAVLNRLRDVFRFKLGDAIEVGDGARNFQDAIVSPGAETLLRHGSFEKALTVGR